MKILVSIPCLYGAEYVRESINSIAYEKNVDVLLIDNGADAGTKFVIHSFFNNENVEVIENETNLYVNKAWQQSIDYFLKSEHSHLIIMNSDLFMQPNWSEVVFNRLKINPNESIIPNIIDDKNFEFIPKSLEVSEAKIVTSGTPGVFIMLNKKQAEKVSELPFDICRIWFGDEWIYTILRSTGDETIVPSNLYSYHLWSATLNQVPRIHELIEEDKQRWEEIGKPEMFKKIKELNG